MKGRADRLDFYFAEARLDEGAKVFCLLELVEKIDELRMEGRGLASESLEIRLKVFLLKADILEFGDIRSDEEIRLEEAAGFFPGLEDESQLRELGSAGAEIEAMEVVLEDEAGDIMAVVNLFFFVDENEEVECVREHVAAADCRVEQLYFLRGADA